MFRVLCSTAQTLLTAFGTDAACCGGAAAFTEAVAAPAPVETGFGCTQPPVLK